MKSPRRFIVTGLLTAEGFCAGGHPQGEILRPHCESDEEAAGLRPGGRRGRPESQGVLPRLSASGADSRYEFGEERRGGREGKFEAWTVYVVAHRRTGHQRPRSSNEMGGRTGQEWWSTSDHTDPNQDPSSGVCQVTWTQA